jgi:hypothetical protein
VEKKCIKCNIIAFNKCPNHTKVFNFSYLGLAVNFRSALDSRQRLADNTNSLSVQALMKKMMQSWNSEKVKSSARQNYTILI